jgi:integrase
MRLSQYLYRRPSGHYYFRVRTPQALKSIIHTVEIKRSLKTTNFTIASKRALPYLSFIVRLSAMSDIDEILRQIKDSGKQMMNLEITGLKIGDVEIDKMVIDPQQEGDHEAASDIINSIREIQQQPSQEIAPKTPQISLQSVMDAYTQEKIATGNWTNKTKEEYTQIYNLLFQIIGKKINTDELSYEISQKVKTTLLALPANIKKVKRFRYKSIDQILKMNEKPRSIATVNKMLTRYSGLLSWGKRQGCFGIKENYFERLTMNDPRDERDLRAAFTSEQLEQIFTEMNNACQTHSYYYWLPRIALYTGMRLNEICQLHLSDIKEIDGIYVFDINDEKEKKLKTKSAKRYTPIHSKLLEMGLLERVEKLKQQGKERLFEELKYSEKDKNYISAASKWFARIRETLGWVGLTPQLDFHSFRHNVITELQEKEIPEYRVAAIVGQKVGQGVTFQRYGKGFAGKTLKKDIEMISFVIEHD